KASGPKGMVAGQMLDLQAEKKVVTLKELEDIHILKTGQLIQFAIVAGAFLGDAPDKDLTYLKEYSYYLGLIFQIQDDILDITGDEDKMGKPTGSDEDNKKSTYPQILGLEGALKQKNEYVHKAKSALSKTKASESYLHALTEYLIERDHKVIDEIFKICYNLLNGMVQYSSQSTVSEGGPKNPLKGISMKFLVLA